MNALSHEQAIELLHEATPYLKAEQRAALAAHLAECDPCRAYADQLSRLQPVLTHALHTRRYTHPADSGKTLPAILQHKRRSMMRKRAFAIVSTVVVAVFAFIAVSSVRLPDQSVTGFQQTATPAPASTTTLSATLVVSKSQNTPTPPTRAETLMPDLWDEKVDISVAKLHVRCFGTGSPTVVFNAGSGGIWVTWEQVMFKVAKFTRVCAYDRAGVGGSSQGPKPRTSQQMADELSALLEKGKIPGPYVLVSHSTSNWIDRLYTVQHRDQVAALVFVSPFHEDMISGTLEILAPYPDELATARAEIASQGEGQSVDDFLASADQVRATGPLGDLPLVLLARSGYYPSDKPYAAQEEAMLVKQEEQLLALSTKSVRLRSNQKGHHIHINEPLAVVDAIRLAISPTLPLTTLTNVVPDIATEGDTSQNFKFEPNDDFDQATLIGLNAKYGQLNFGVLTPTVDGWDSDYFKVRVKPGMLVTCRTSDLSAGTDTNLILYDSNLNGISGQDDVDRAAGDLSSSVTYAVQYEGWLYVLVGEGFSRSPAEAQQATYSLECSTDKD